MNNVLGGVLKIHVHLLDQPLPDVPLTSRREESTKNNQYGAWVTEAPQIFIGCWG
jgi:hypothetical protein